MRFKVNTMDWMTNFNGWQLALMATTFTWGMTALGALPVLFFKSRKQTAIAVIMGLASGIMLASVIFSLMLPVTEDENASVILPVGIVVGALSIVALDLLLKKLNIFSKDEKKKSCASMCFAVTAHNIPEGLAVGVAFGAVGAVSGNAYLSALMLAVGIGLQNFPEGTCIAFSLRANGMKPTRAFFWGQLSGIVEIAAGVVGAVTASISVQVVPWALAYSAGAMLAVICSELIPESYSCGKTLPTIAIVIGFVLMMILEII